MNDRGPSLIAQIRALEPIVQRARWELQAYANALIPSEIKLTINLPVESVPALEKILRHLEDNA